MDIKKELVYISGLRRLAKNIVEIKRNKKYKKLSKKQKKAWNKYKVEAQKYLDHSKIEFKNLTKKLIVLKNKKIKR